MNKYEQDMYIDEDALDMECLEQAALMAKYSRLLAEAQQERDLAKEALELSKAEIDKKIRKSPEKYGIEKITESVITNTILLDGYFQDMSSTYHDANFEFNVLKGVVSAIEQRKSMLEGLVKLHGQNYFAGPSIPHNLSEIREKKMDAMVHRAGASLKKVKPKNKN